MFALSNKLKFYILIMPSSIPPFPQLLDNHSRNYSKYNSHLSRASIIPPLSNNLLQVKSLHFKILHFLRNDSIVVEQLGHLRTNSPLFPSGCLHSNSTLRLVASSYTANYHLLQLFSFTSP